MAVREEGKQIMVLAFFRCTFLQNILKTFITEEACAVRSDCVSELLAHG